MNPVAVILRAVQIVRGWGIVVTFEPGWETRGNGYLSRWVGVIVHHTGTPSSLANPFPTRRILRDGRSNLSGPLCNSAGPADGSIHVMAAQAANHAGASGGRSMGPLPVVSLFNPQVFGHEIDYAGAVPMLLGQYRAAALWALALLIALKESGQIPAVDVQRARAHAETSITGKWDPGFADGRTIDMNAFRAAVAAGPQEDDMTPEEFLNTKLTWWNGKQATVKDVFTTVYVAGQGLLGNAAFPGETGAVQLPPLVGIKASVDGLTDDESKVLAAINLQRGEVLNKLAEVMTAVQSVDGKPSDEQMAELGEYLNDVVGGDYNVTITRATQPDIA